MKDFTLNIDGTDVKAQEGMTVLEAARKGGIDIPTLCYHPALKPYGACRICTVEIIRGERSILVTSCTYPAEPGLVVKTDTPRVMRNRKMILELMLARCTGVEIIQDLAAAYGIEKPRLRKTKDENCILCGLCVRMCEERMGVSATSFVGRGVDRKVDTPFHIQSEVCMTCGACASVCPTGAIELEEITKNEVVPIPSEFDQGLGFRRPIYVPFLQAVPNIPVIDRERCVHFLTDGCKVCENFCEAGAIKYDQEDEIVDLDVGAVIVAPGFDEFDAKIKGEYGYGIYPNVVTSIELERMLCASGPFKGHLRRPSDGREPKSMAFIQCVGSRDTKSGNDYCSSVCCTYAIKEAIIAKEHSPETKSTIFFMDMRTYGKGFEEFYLRAKNEYGARFVRARVSSVEEVPEIKDLRISYETDEGKLLRKDFDLVVLSVGLTSSISARDLAERLGIELNGYGFCKTSGLEPVATSKPGIFACGAFQGPKDIPETVAQASGAAARASELLSQARGTLVAEEEYPPEIDVRGQGPRIGVFVCHCGINIGAYVDVPAVAECARTLPNVVYAEDNLYTCSQDTQERIKEMIGEHNLNRVVVASCTPRTHEPLFQQTIREAGLNKYLFEMANIRDQDSWVHMKLPEEATEKAKDLVRMAVAKARLIQPLETRSVDVVKRGLVIGGGIAGMTASLRLAAEGYETYLVEKEPELGGMARDIYYTIEGDDVQKFLEELVEKVRNSERITVFTETDIEKIDGFVGNFKTTLRPAKSRKLKAESSPHTSRKPRDPGDETQDAGDTTQEAVEVEHGVVIVATGAKEYEPKEYLYGKDERVITQRQLERRLADGGRRTADVRTVVMIQCVGSRNSERTYCSRVCCSEAVKNAVRLKELDTSPDVYVLFRDMRTYGFKEDYYRRARELGVIFLGFEEGEEPEVRKNGGKVEVLIRDRLLDEKLLLEPDLLVLSTAIVPYPENEEIAKHLKVPLNNDGFFLEAHAKLRPVDFATDGVFLCGLAHGPRFIEESISQANAAVSRACTILSKDEIETQGSVSQVDELKCNGCGLCVEVCAYKAIELVRKKVLGTEKTVAQVNEALCKGCGACSASCRSGSIDLRGFTNDEICSQIQGFAERVELAA